MIWLIIFDKINHFKKFDEGIHEFSHWNWRKYIINSVIWIISLEFIKLTERQDQYFQNVWPDNNL